MKENVTRGLIVALIFSALVALLLVVLPSCSRPKTGPTHTWVVKGTEQTISAGYSSNHFILECTKDAQRVKVYGWEIDEYPNAIIGDTIYYQHEDPVTYPQSNN